MMQRNLLELQTAASLQGVRTLRESLEQALKASALPAEAVRGMLLGLSELACNSVRHAQPAASYLRLQVTQDGQVLECQLWDDGGSFSTFAQRLEALPGAQSSGAGLQESGMGLRLIAQTLPGITQQRVAGENRYLWSLPCVSQQPRIVVVDDDQLISELLRLYLEPEYQVRCFSDAAQALQQLVREPPDLVISDINMPQMDGLALRQGLLDNPQTALLPFIFITGQQDEHMQQQAYDLGVDDFLHKPLLRRDLHKVVERVLSRSRRLLAAAGAQLDARITASLKPSVPRFAAPFQLALCSREAEAGGGDFVFHRQWAGQHTLVLGDCMGHGRQAKFFVHAYQAYLHSLLHSAVAPLAPAQLLKGLSDAMLADGLLAASLVTCVALQWQEGSTQVQLAVAGHPPPLLFSSLGCHALPLQGALPGLLPGVEYPQLSFALAAGESLLLYSDGLLEGLAPRAEPAQALAKLQQLLQAQAHLSPVELAVWLLQYGFNGRDDACALIVATT
jgi:DNA-binding response OmpR family regulator/anti-sigma regulatory factor (Ser/Thr protein kinase)